MDNLRLSSADGQLVSDRGFLSLSHVTEAYIQKVHLKKMRSGLPTVKQSDCKDVHLEVTKH